GASGYLIPVSRPVPRPRSRRKAAGGGSPVPDGRQRILEASLMAFREKGYAATTVDDLCRVAGVTKGAFFHHFENKEDAALEAIALWNARTRELFEGAPWSQVEDPRERLMAYLDFRARLANEGLPGLA